MLYLKIANPCNTQQPLELFVVLGISTNRHDDRAIGNFGSGFKLGINSCLRAGLNPVVFNGKQKIEFFIEPIKIDDGLMVKDFGRVGYIVNGRKKEMTSFSLEYGKNDWNELAMGLREFVSNCLDRTIRETNSYNKVVIEIVAENQVRAKDGETRVFIPLSADVQKFYQELPQRFLHFKDKNLLKEKILIKDKPGNANIYKNGVFVRQVESVYPALFDYNFGDELELDESRNVDNYMVASVAGSIIAHANPDILLKIFTQLEHTDRFWEANFDSYYLSHTKLNEEKELVKKNWLQAWNMFAGNALASEAYPALLEFIRKKGFSAKTIMSSSWLKAIKSWGIKTHHDMIGENNPGLETLPPTKDILLCLDEVWNYLELLGKTNGKTKPQGGCFKQIMNAGTQILGYYENDEIYVHEDYSVGQSPAMWKIVLEECSHHISGAGDSSRDLQNYLFDVIYEVRKLI